MQVKRRQSQQERTHSTRSALIAAARASFVAHGYDKTTTPDLAVAAKVTRGALYHHFEDKRELFHAVVDAENAALARDIERATLDETDFIRALIEGGRAYLKSMQVPGRTRLLLVDAPAILTRKELEDIDAANGERTLRDVLRLAQQQGAIRMLPLNELSYVLSGAYDRAALAMGAGAKSGDVEAVIEAIVSGLRC
jgi:AcrR family transcriptional regulator